MLCPTLSVLCTIAKREITLCVLCAARLTTVAQYESGP